MKFSADVSFSVGVVEFGRIQNKHGEKYLEGNLDELVAFNEELGASEIALLSTL